MKKIKITKGFVSLVSDVDFQRVSKYKWYFSKNYARNNGLGYMHRLIMREMLQSEIPKGTQVDHINRDKLDNRRENLRLANSSENQANCEKKIGRHGVRGVKTHRRKWEARIQKNGKKVYIGLFNTKEEAAAAYNAKAREIFGEFAYQNPPHLIKSQS